jgi:glutaredoxin
MDSKVKKLYKKINNDNKEIIMFGLSYCVYCKKTLELLKKNKISYKYYSIDKHKNLFFKILTEVAKYFPNFQIDTMHKTVPIIFYKKKFIGGFTEISKYLQ